MIVEIAQTTLTMIGTGTAIVFGVKALGGRVLLPRDARRLNEGLDRLERESRRKDALIENLRSQNDINELVIETLTQIASNADAERELQAYSSREVCQ